MQTVLIKKKYSASSPNDKQNALTYSSIGSKKSAAVAQNNPLIEGFTSQQQAEFDNGITIENYAKKKGITL